MHDKIFTTSSSASEGVTLARAIGRNDGLRARRPPRSRCPGRPTRPALVALDARGGPSRVRRLWRPPSTRFPTV